MIGVKGLADNPRQWVVLVDADGRGRPPNKTQLPSVQLAEFLDPKTFNLKKAVDNRPLLQVALGHKTEAQWEQLALPKSGTQAFAETVDVHVVNKSSTPGTKSASKNQFSAIVQLGGTRVRDNVTKMEKNFTAKPWERHRRFWENAIRIGELDLCCPEAIQKRMTEIKADLGHHLRSCTALDGNCLCAEDTIREQNPRLCPDWEMNRTLEDQFKGMQPTEQDRNYVTVPPCGSRPLGDPDGVFCTGGGGSDRGGDQPSAITGLNPQLAQLVNLASGFLATRVLSPPATPATPATGVSTPISTNTSASTPPAPPPLEFDMEGKMSRIDALLAAGKITEAMATTAKEQVLAAFAKHI